MMENRFRCTLPTAVWKTVLGTGLSVALFVLTLLVASIGAQAQTATVSGPLSGFDVINQTGQTFMVSRFNSKGRSNPTFTTLCSASATVVRP